MKKNAIIFLLAAALLLTMTGCFCDHQWAEANCVSPKTCTLCEETEGEALGHTWVDATCTSPKTCSVCAVTEGEALGHTWVDATCTDPKTCSVCAVTEGEALGHTWAEATTEAPQTCTVCAATEGERIITDPRFTSASAAPVVGTWKYAIQMTGEDMGIAGFTVDFNWDMIMRFGKAGELEVQLALSDEEGFLSSLESYLVDSLYAEFASMNLSKEDSNEAMKKAYGMTVEEYAAAYVDAVDTSAFASTISGVYYVADGNIYASDSWDGEMDPVGFSVSGDTLTLSENFIMGSEESMDLSRITE